MRAASSGVPHCWFDVYFRHSRNWGLCLTDRPGARHPVEFHNCALWAVPDALPIIHWESKIIIAGFFSGAAGGRSSSLSEAISRPCMMLLRLFQRPLLQCAGSFQDLFFICPGCSPSPFIRRTGNVSFAA